MAFGQRYLEKFESVSASLSYTFPLYDYEWDSNQGFRGQFGRGVGADYAHDFGGQGPWPVEPSEEIVRFNMGGFATPADLETALNTMQSTLRRIGFGKLFTIDDTGTRRWAYARMDARPAVAVRVNTWMRQPVSARFLRLSDWFSTSQTSGSQTCDASPEDFTINNPGNLPCLTAVFRFRSNGATGGTNMTLTNLTNGYAFSTTRDLTDAAHELKVDCEASSVERSVNDGGTYTDDYALFSVAADQVGFMVLEPGDNSMRYTDGATPNLSLEWAFYAPWA